MKRSKFSLSNYKLFSCDMGELVPCGLTEVLPGDSIQQATNALLRCSPLLAPVMHPVHVRIHHWFVPHRLVWEDFEDFITGGPDGMNISVFPTITFADGVSVGSLADYLGIPTDVDNITCSALPFRAYALIFNEWYRDQDLQTPLPWSDESGNDTETSLAMQNCAWEKDYFTSSRPWEQKGPQITIPLGDSAPVGGNTGTGSAFEQWQSGISSSVPGTMHRPNAATVPNGVPLRTDLTQASAVTVNLLREAMALQRYQEARARFGSRYVEYLRYLGIKSSDARLQRPEYLGGGKQTIQFSEVLQTAEGSDPVGEMRGHGIQGVGDEHQRT